MMHEGHRERLRTKFEKSPDLLEDHELFELLLFFSIPRANTNETAHALIERFGSVRGVIDAEMSSLKSVENVGDKSALLLRVVSEVISRYERSKFEYDTILDDEKRLYQYLHSLFVGTSIEKTYFLLFDSARRLITCEKLAQGDARSNHIATDDVLNLINRFRPVYAIMTHNHPSGRAQASGDDVYTTNTIFNLLKLHHVSLIDHYIVAGSKIIPMLKMSR